MKGIRTDIGPDYRSAGTILSVPSPRITTGAGCVKSHFRTAVIIPVTKFIIIPKLDPKTSRITGTGSD
jgi:hypothetical protein